MAYRFKHFLREQEDTEEMNGIRISRPHYTAHNLSDDHLEHLTSHPDVQNGMGPVTLTIPENLPKLKSGLVGPSVGDPPVTRNTPGVHTANRGDGRVDSRMVHGLHRETDKITGVVIPDPIQKGRKWLVTGYGGPSAPREPEDQSMERGSPEHKESVSFWKDHALLTNKKER